MMLVISMTSNKFTWCFRQEWLD